MKHTITVVFIAFVFLSSTCKKAMQVPDPELKKIFGRWEWVNTSGGFAGKTTTPASMGYSARVEFSNKDIYQIYKNDTLTARGKFSFAKKASIHSNKDVWVMSMSFLPDTCGLELPVEVEVSFRGNDTLILSEQVYDGYGHEYVRIK